jgi:hypothetical protein
MKMHSEKMRKFLMATKNLSEDEAISLMSVAVDFGVTQVVNGNWGVHAVIGRSSSRNPCRRSVVDGDPNYIAITVSHTASDGAPRTQLGSASRKR